MNKPLILGVARNTIKLNEYAHPEDKERFISSIRSLQDGSYDQTLMLRFRNKSGDYQYLEVFLAIQDESYFFAALDVTLRKTDTVARLGGDEFVIILSQVNTEQDALSVAQKILEVVGQTIPLESGKSGQVGASIGISFCPTDGVTIDDLLMASDRAMYQSKKKGKNTFT